MKFRSQMKSHIIGHMRRYAALLAGLVLIGAGTVSAQTTNSTSTLQSQIDQNTAQINELNTEIAQYQTQLDATTKQGQTLQGTINQLNLSIKQTNASISVTTKQINTTQLQITQLGNGIQSDQSTIADEQQGLGQTIQILNETDQEPLAVALLSSNGLSDAWQDFNDVQTIESSINTDISDLAQHKATLAQSQTQQVTKNQQLQVQQKQLTTQKGSLSATQSTQSQLLAQTKSQESTYQQLIAQKTAEEASFESALTDLKAQYNQAVNPSQVLSFAPGTLAWPICAKVKGVYEWPTCGENTVTQFFGDTPFSNSHEALYSGHGHDGLDIAAPIGTPVHAALTGTVLATGNTDATPGCQGGSFGKWIMLEHSDGLNTMYAHLSQISVTPGQQVQTGDVIGYSGETGYATGPHLHFGVYVSSVTQIIPLGQATGGDAPCSKAIMPVPPVSGYLNPLNYLPATPYVNDAS